ncbi:succinate dehydrogenase, cytochrome b556 subunit [Acinetobacter towneri DSM 14962 = CIP 107472]|jgi:succinate dehydrogenase / fumarate reductase cytochrome b subunit|nr:succinate dehydrogenase, cytochrome b556 subunit [Acinetobacter towneri DSM 14962 = CIP 107472]
MNLPNNASFPSNLFQQTPDGVFTYRMPAVKSNRPVNLSMGQVLEVNLKSPVAIASILHRLSGVIVFLLVPVLLWLLDKSLSSPEGFAQVQEIFNGFFVRFIVWVFVAGLIYHFIAGVKHLLADLGFAEELQSGRIAATISLILSAIGIVAAFVWIVI